MKYYLGILARFGVVPFTLAGGLLTGCGPGTTPPAASENVSGEASVIDSGEAARREARRRAIGAIKIDLDEARQVLRSTDEAFRANEYSDIAEHAEELVKLAKGVRRQTLDLDESESEIIRLLVDRIQHASHELEAAAKDRSHQGAHHALENLNEEFESLRNHVQGM